MNKALDYNGLLEAHKDKKLLKKQLSYPVWAEVKYDGNYVVVKVDISKTTFFTSGNLTYTHEDTGGDIFNTLPVGVYLAERIGTDGRLGDRVNCNLHGPKAAQKSKGHTYIIHDWMPTQDWVLGDTMLDFDIRTKYLMRLGIPGEYLPIGKFIYNKNELEDFLKNIVILGYEGIMLKQPKWKWKRTKSRTIDLCKYKKRRTADLLCTNVTEGEGKYVGKIGALVLEDSIGRVVNVGSGLSDRDRNKPTEYYIGKIIEIEYEQIIDTYIQPAYIQVRDDKEDSD